MIYILPWVGGRPKKTLQREKQNGGREQSSWWKTSIPPAASEQGVGQLELEKNQLTLVEMEVRLE